MKPWKTSSATNETRSARPSFRLDPQWSGYGPILPQGTSRKPETGRTPRSCLSRPRDQVGTARDSEIGPGILTSSRLEWLALLTLPSLMTLLQEGASGSPSRHDQPVPGPCRCHEQQRPLPVFVVGQGCRVVSEGCHTQWHGLGVDPCQQHDRELQTLDPVHGRQTNATVWLLPASIEDLVRDAELLEQRLVLVSDERVRPGDQA